MIDSIKKLCMNCMNELYGSDTCSVCGYDNKFLFLSNELSLSPGTTLFDDQYVVGNVLSFNGEGFSYIGYDFKENIKVWIRELYPDTMVMRGNDGKEVVPHGNYATQFKTLKVDFSDIHSILMGFKDTDGIVPVLNYFEQNNTVYCITKFIQSITLEEFLQQIGGSLDYNQASAIFEPMLKTLSNIHMNNLVHRGISPSNLIIDVNGDLRLTNFCISSVRTVKSELTAEIYPGYTAPEQYNVTSWQGTWTDVYAVAAVLYRVLTGTLPQESILRAQNDTLVPASKINPDIPSNMAFAIQKGLIIDPEKRVETVESFYSLLFNGSDEFQKRDMTKQVDLSKGMQKNTGNPNNRHRGMRGKSNIPTILVSMFVTMIVLLISLLGLISAMSAGKLDIDTGDDGESSSEQSSLFIRTKSRQIPDLENRYLQNIAGDEGVDDYFQIKVLRSEYSETVPKDMVISQSIEAGTVVPEGQIEVVSVVVSKGPVDLPEMKGFELEKAEEMLESLGITKEEYDIIESFSNDQEEGKVVSTQRSGGKIIIMVSKGRQEIPSEVPSSSDTSASVPGIYSSDSTAPPSTSSQTQSSKGNYWESQNFGSF